MKLGISALAVAALTPMLAHADTALQNLTAAQLEDADVLDANGREIGEVERVLLSADGKIRGFIVEIDQRAPTPDKHVEISLRGLKAVPDRGDAGEFNLQTDQTKDALLALPAAK